MNLQHLTRRSSRARLAVSVLAATMVMAMATGPVLADKLIVFRNGKVLRAKKVSTEGAWTLALLGKSATVGVRTADIIRVEDAVGDKKGGDYNRAATENRGVSRTGGGASRGGNRGTERSSSVQERIEQRQQDLEKRRNRNAQRDNTSLSRGGAPGNSLRPGSKNRGFNRSRLPGGVGQRSVTDLRVRRPARQDDDN